MSAPKHVYFLGIGGIGMSAVARYYLGRGVRVSGYDLRPSDLTNSLAAEGAEIHYDDRPGELPTDIDLVVWTPAVPEVLGERSALEASGVPMLKRAAALGRLSAGHRVLAAAGTHGKTTMSAMAAYLLREGGLDPVGFLGGISADYGTNYLDGAGEWLVVEADEYDRSFLQLSPDVTIVSYIEPDHLDVYGEAAAFEQSFRDYVGRVRAGGVVVTKPAIAERLAAELGEVAVWTYGIDDAEAAWRATDVRIADGAFAFDLHYPGGQVSGVRLAMPGRHNVENAVAAIAAAAAAGVAPERSAGLLAGFKGVARRFERLGRFGRAEVVTDYAHHPTEVRAAVNAARELYGSYRVIGIFQPHLYSRTRDFAEGFAAALSDLQEVVLLELYPARETPIDGVSSMTIFDYISTADKYLVHTSEAAALLEVLDGDVLLFMGAGDIDRLARDLVRGG